MKNNSAAATRYDLGIIGCGDIGRRTAALYQQANLGICGVVRSQASAERGRAAGSDMLQADLDHLTDQTPLPAVRQCFYMAPPPPEGKTDRRLRQALTALSQTPQRIVLISTTGVYGDSGGSWIDETAAPAPNSDRARRRLDAEQALQNWCAQQACEWVILRVPGIYADSRLPRARLARGEPVLERAAAPYTNRIHAHDLARLCKAAMERAPDGSIYNACDGRPSTMTDYFNAVANHLGLPRPPQIAFHEAQKRLSPGMLSYLRESRRIRNARLLSELDFTFDYPSLAEGLGHD